MTDQLVEKIRLLEIHDVTGLRQDHQSRSDECVFQEKTRFDASLVFVTDDDQRRHLQLPDVRLEIVKRRARALKSARHVRRALRIMFGELAGEFGKAAGILNLECDATGAPAVGLRDGGQQQRVGLAMAFANRPRLIVLDEPTTGLDVTTQAHVLSTVRELAALHEVAVMYAGRVVEIGGADELFRSAGHPYTRRLVGAIPRLTGGRSLVGIPGHA